MPFQPDAQRPLTYYLAWIPSVGFGHAALIIDSQAFCQEHRNNMVSLAADLDAGMPYDLQTLNNDNYVSWYSTPRGFFLTGLRARSHTYIIDSTINQAGEPNKIVVMSELDRDAMRARWHETRDKAGANWKLFDKNCSTVVARILKAGGGNSFCRNKRKSHPLFWTPADCYQYAKSIAKHGGMVGGA